VTETATLLRLEEHAKGVDSRVVGPRWFGNAESPGGSMISGAEMVGDTGLEPMTSSV
jgi:hypothetical protein